jgi:7-cyano-7-deazaguanine reductase
VTVKGREPELLLGKNTPVVDAYAPELLYPIPRGLARGTLGLGPELPFYGVDLWHAYELSWLDITGRPVARVGRFTVPAGSPNIVESKSFKLYLNSLNNTRFGSEEEAGATLRGELSRVAGAPIELQLFAVDDAALAGERLPGECIDDCPAAVGNEGPGAALLEVDDNQVVEERLYSHLLRSLCPVTGQPDWATLWLHYRGNRVDRTSLLRYVLSYRRHQEFHEQCAERIFCDLQQRLAPRFIHLQACYTRRGGLDINPFRSSSPEARPLARLNRQ